VESFKNLILKNYEASKIEFYMNAFWHTKKASWLKSWTPKRHMGEMKCISYFYVGQGYSGELCGPWASCYMFIKEKMSFTCKNYSAPRAFAPWTPTRALPWIPLAGWLPGVSRQPPQTPCLLLCPRSEIPGSATDTCILVLRKNFSIHWSFGLDYFNFSAIVQLTLKFWFDLFCFGLQ
jgi:hypothetical protein